MFQTCSNSQLLRRVLWISAEQTIGASLKHKNTQPLYIFNRENPQNSEPQNGPRSGLDYIALDLCYFHTAYLHTWEVDLIEILEIMAQMWQYVIFLSLKPTKVTSDFILY